MPRKRKVNRQKLREAESANIRLPELLARLDIMPLQWDYLIVSDGSGTTMSKPCGWASIMIHRSSSFERKFFHGTMSTGSNVVAEIMAFVEPLQWLSRQKTRKKPALVHILTDCQVVCNVGNKVITPKTNQALWYYVGALQRKIGQFKFHWMPRESTFLNRFADRLAGFTRCLLVEEQETMHDYALRDLLVPGMKGIDTVHDLNPF